MKRSTQPHIVLAGAVFSLLSVLASFSHSDDPWFLSKRSQIVVPFEESIGIGGDGSDIHRAGDLFARRFISGQVLGATPFIAPPTWNSASAWLFAGAICRTATAWYSLETPESLAARGITPSSATRWIEIPLIDDVNKLKAQPVIQYSTITITIKPQGNGIYSFKETLAEETNTWYMPFPANKKVDPDGLFTATINGWEFAPLARIILGEGGRQLGLQFMLLDGSLWPVGTEGIGSIQLIDFTPWVVPEYATEQMRTPKTVLHEGFAKAMVNF